MTLAELAARIGATLVGDAAIDVSSCNTLEDATAGQLSFLSNPKYADQMATTQASAVVVGPGVSSDRLAVLQANEPYLAFLHAVLLLHGWRKHPHQGVHPAAHVEPTAVLDEDVTIYPGVYVGPRVRIGRGSVLYPNVVVYEDCVIGQRVQVHAGTVIGQDGFGYALRDGAHQKIPQVGNVVIEDDVEIGANCAIARAHLGSTVIGKGTKIDALVMVAHGCKIGAHGLLVAQVGLAGSVRVGHHVTLAGQVGVAGHLKIGDNVTVGAQAGIMNDLADNQSYLGAPAMPLAQARRVYVTFTQLPELAKRVKELEQAVTELQAEDGGDQPGSSTKANK